MLICQISDLHIRANRKRAYGVVDTSSMLEACVATINRLDPQPDVVVATGDLVDFGLDEEYALCAEILALLKAPLLLLPGNHDERGRLRACFPSHGYLRQCPSFLQYVIDDWPVRLVALDTVIPGQSGGELCGARIEWLERTLKAVRGKPTVVLMHHPPFPTGIGHMDRIGLIEAGALETVIVGNPQVEGLLCGHLHRAIHVRFGGTIASTCPSPAHQVALDLRPDGADDFVLEPPGYQLHWWNGRHLVTHTAVLGNFAGPYPFRSHGRLID